jgi:protein-disulfide isomerase
MTTVTMLKSQPAMLLRRVLISIALFVAVGSQPACADEADTTPGAILNDPAAPVAGNPKGDLTIVVFFDYNCPFCKKAEPNLDRLVKADGKIRLVYKDWPILSEASIRGAQLVLAAKYLDEYTGHENIGGADARSHQGLRDRHGSYGCRSRSPR